VQGWNRDTLRPRPETERLEAGDAAAAAPIAESAADSSTCRIAEMPRRHRKSLGVSHRAGPPSASVAVILRGA
jgi:hypothetical protein